MEEVLMKKYLVSLLLCLLLIPSINANQVTFMGGNKYKYVFDYDDEETNEAIFEFPKGVKVTSSDGFQPEVQMDLSNGIHLIIQRSSPGDYADNKPLKSTAENAEKIWGGWPPLTTLFDLKKGSLTTEELNNGDYVVFGKYATGDDTYTRVVRTYDINSNGLIDHYLVFGEDENIDKDFMIDLATNTKLYHR